MRRMAPNNSMQRTARAPPLMLSVRPLSFVGGEPMAGDKAHEPPEAIEAHLERCLEFARRLCLHNDPRFRAGGLKLLRQLFRAHRSGRMTTAQERRYNGLLKYLRPHVLAMTREGLTIPAVVAAEVERVRDRTKGRSA